nr:hypothetical protein [Tanacetum cinerariifolium]
MVEKNKLDEDLQGKQVDATIYHGMIRSLIYLTSSRPNLIYSVCLCARYHAKPTKKHLQAMKPIFRYLKGTINMGLWYSKDINMSLTAYADADHAGCQDTRRSTSGSVQFLGDKLIIWSSKSKRALPSRILMYCDNKSEIALCCNNVQHSRAKHIDLRYHFIKEIMSSITAQQAKLDLELVPKEKRLEIGKCNGRLNLGKIQREPTFQIVLDALSLTPCYSAFLITADVPEVYMHQFWDFVYKEISSLNDDVVDQMHQPWRTFAALINRSLSGKTTSLDKLRLSRAQILWGMYHQKNVDYVKLLWEDFIYQINNRAYKNQGRCTILDSSKLSFTTSLLKTRHPEMKETKAYKTYLGFAIGATPFKIAMKFQKASPSKKDLNLNLVPMDEEHKSAKKKYEEVHRKSLRDFHKTHPSGSGTVTKTAPSAAKIKPSITNKRTGVKPGVPDVTEEVSTKSKPGSWGKNEDDSSNEQDSKIEGSNQERDDGDDNTQSDSEKGSDSEHETSENESGSKSDQEENKEYIGDDKEEEEDEFIKTLSNDTDNEDKTKITDKSKGDEDEEMDYTTSQLYNDVKTEVLDTSSSHSSELEAKFLKFTDIPTTKAEIVSPMDVQVHHERSRKDKDKDQDPSAGSDRGLKKRKTSKDEEPTKGLKAKESQSGSSKGTQSQSKSFGKSSKTFDELMSTLIEFSAYIMNGLKITNLTQETLLGPALKLLKGTRTNYAELEYDFEECYMALSEKLDWENPEGDDYPFDLTKPLPLVMNGNRQMVPVDYIFNIDLKYMQGGISTMTYTTSLTKTKAAKYDLLGIENMVPNIWINRVKVMRKHEYGYLKEIIVRRVDNDLYTFKEGDFLCLRINDIEDILILVVQNRHTNLSGNDVSNFAIALRMFTKSLIIHKRVKDLQLGVKSYQKKINVTKPETTKPGIIKRDPYTPYQDAQGFIYVDNKGRNRLMRSDKLYKFSDRILTRLRTSLDDITKNIRMEYLPQRRWSTLEKKRANIMIKEIDKQLKEKRIMRSLEKFVGGRHYGTDLRLLQRII